MDEMKKNRDIANDSSQKKRKLGHIFKGEGSKDNIGRESKK